MIFYESLVAIYESVENWVAIYESVGFEFIELVDFFNIFPQTFALSKNVSTLKLGSSQIIQILRGGG